MAVKLKLNSKKVTAEPTTLPQFFFIMKTIAKPNVYTFNSYKEIADYVENCTGKEVKLREPLEYPHGKMITGKITRIQRGKTDCQSGLVFFMATFTDGFQAEYATNLFAFFFDYNEQI